MLIQFVDVDDVAVLEFGAAGATGLRRVGGRPVGLGFARGTKLTFVTTCGPSHATAGHQAVDARPNALQQIAHHLPPPLTGFEVVQLLQDRLGVVLVHPDLGHGPRRPQPDGGMRRGAEQVGERLDGAPVRAGIRRMAAWKVAWRAASYSAWNTASSVSQRCSVRSPMRHRAAAWPIVGSDRSAGVRQVLEMMLLASRTCSKLHEH